MGDAAAGAGAPRVAVTQRTVKPSRAIEKAIGHLYVDYESSEMYEPDTVPEAAKAISQFMDENPTVDIASALNGKLIDVITQSKHEASIPLYQRLKREHQSYFAGGGEDHQNQLMEWEMEDPDTTDRDRWVFHQKMTGERANVLKTQRLFGKASSSPLPRGTESLVTEALTGKQGSLGEQLTQTKKPEGGRRKTRRHRKTHRGGRKTKSRR